MKKRMTRNECYIEAENLAVLSQSCEENEILYCHEMLLDRHFNPKPYSFDELHAHMWVWIEPLQSCAYIAEVNEKARTLSLGNGTIAVFLENTYYPLVKGQDFA